MPPSRYLFSDAVVDSSSVQDTSVAPMMYFHCPTILNVEDPTPAITVNSLTQTLKDVMVQ